MSEITDRLKHLSPEQRSRLLTRLAVATSQAGSAATDVQSASDTVPLLPAQRLLLARLDSYGVDVSRYPVTSLVQVAAPVSADVTRSALAVLLGRHEALRMRFSRDERGWRQDLMSPPPPPEVSIVDVVSRPAAERAAMATDAYQDARHGLDVTVGRLVRLAVVRGGPDEPVKLFLAVHHLAADAYSLGILWRDFWSAYRQADRGEQVRLPTIVTPYPEWVRRLHGYAGSHQFSSDARYWQDLPWQGAPPAADGDPLTGGPARPTTVQVVLPQEDTARVLDALPAAAQLPEAVLAGLVDALRQATGRAAHRVAVVRHGRTPLLEGIDLSRTIGWLTAHPMLVLDLAGADRPVEAVASVSRQLRRMPMGGLTWEWLLLRPEYHERLRTVMRRPALAFDYVGLGGLATGPDGPRPVRDEVDALAGVPNVWIGNVLMVVAQLAEGQLRVRLLFDERAHRTAEVRAAADHLLAFLRQLSARQVTS